MNQSNDVVYQKRRRTCRLIAGRRASFHALFSTHMHSEHTYEEVSSAAFDSTYLIRTDGEDCGEVSLSLSSRSDVLKTTLAFTITEREFQD